MVVITSATIGPTQPQNGRRREARDATLERGDCAVLSVVTGGYQPVPRFLLTSLPSVALAFGLWWVSGMTLQEMHMVVSRRPFARSSGPDRLTEGRRRVSRKFLQDTATRTDPQWGAAKHLPVEVKELLTRAAVSSTTTIDAGDDLRNLLFNFHRRGNRPTRLPAVHPD